MSFIHLLSVLLFLACREGSAVYVYKGDPFQPGPLEVSSLTLNEDPDGIPKRTVVFYPTAAGQYAPVLFVPGVFGAVYTELYATVLANFAGYGFIIAGVDVQWPLLGKKHDFWAKDIEKVVLDTWNQERVLAEPDELFKTLDWLMASLNQKVFPSHEAEGVAADWSKLGLMSHSLGAQYITEMLQKNSTFAKAVAFLEPSSIIFSKPLGYAIPALSYGTQFCTEDPKCCLPGFSYVHYYSLLTCPKILMNVTGFGHCDINDENGWELCHLVDFCKTVKGNNRDLYREVFVPGVLTSLFGTYLQDNPDLVTHITHREDMPVALGRLNFDLNCTLPLENENENSFYN